LRPGELREVGGDVRRRGEAAVDAAEAARAHEGDAGPAAGGERAAGGRRADGALDGTGGEVAGPRLARLGAELLELLAAQADADGAVDHSDGRGHGPRFADAALA